MAQRCCQQMQRQLHSVPMSKKINILTDDLPENVTLYGVDYPVHTGFKNWVRISCILENENIKDAHVFAKILKLCYKEALPPNRISAFLGALDFLSRGTDFSVPQSPHSERLYSFSSDADVIYSAFYSKYGIDLQKEDLHWYKFCCLFETLADENPFKTVLKIRTTDEKEIKNHALRNKVAALKSKYRITSAAEVDVAANIADLF